MYTVIALYNMIHEQTHVYVGVGTALDTGTGVIYMYTI